MNNGDEDFFSEEEDEEDATNDNFLQIKNKKIQ